MQEIRPLRPTDRNATLSYDEHPRHYLDYSQVLLKDKHPCLRCTSSDEYTRQYCWSSILGQSVPQPATSILHNKASFTNQLHSARQATLSFPSAEDSQPINSDLKHSRGKTLHQGFSVRPDFSGRIFSNDRNLTPPKYPRSGGNNRQSLAPHALANCNVAKLKSEHTQVRGR